MTDFTHVTPIAASSNANGAVTGVDRRTLEAIFRHPLSHNLSWREVVNLFTAIGGVEEKHNGEFEFRTAEDRLVMKRPHNKDLTGPEVMGLRHFLTRTGWSPAEPAPPNIHTAAPETGLIIVVDHAGAKVYRIERTSLGGRNVIPDDPKHLLHHIERTMRDKDREETYPADEAFFEQVADAVSAGGDIVVIGHGKGQSNEANHLSAYLQSHHKATYARIVREIVADLPHMTTPELLDLGRHAFT
jgi:hypothetical protein